MRPHPRRARTDPRSPRAWATSDRNGHISNHEDLQWQYEWAGTGLVNKRILVSRDELDVPQRQLGTIIIPPDPPPIQNARPEQYPYEEVPVSTRITTSGKYRVTTSPNGSPLYSLRIISGNFLSLNVSG